MSSKTGKLLQFINYRCVGAELASRAATIERLGAQLDARLNPESRAPLAVALSGGSDSLALTLMARGGVYLAGGLAARWSRCGRVPPQ